MAKNEDKSSETKMVKKKMKPRGGNSPVIGTNGLMLEEGDNNKFTSVSLQLLNMDKVDLHDENAVAERLNEYFNLMAEKDMKPTIAGMAMALGTTRQTLWAIKNNQPLGGTGILPNMPQQVTDLIKKAYLLMETLWESYMLSGKLNPAAGVFFGINNYGYLDVKQVNLVPEPVKNGDNDYDADAIRERYLISDNNSDSEND